MDSFFFNLGVNPQLKKPAQASFIAIEKQILTMKNQKLVKELLLYGTIAA
ncbi:hypothetical protein [Parapedobacter sp. 2B3]